MKYILKKELLFLVVNFLLLQHLCAQPTPNHLNLRVGISGMQLHGKEFAEMGSFVSPALFPNYNAGLGWNLMAEYRVNSFMGAGVKIHWGSFSGWEMEEHTLYDRSEISHFFVAPTLRLNTTPAILPGDVFTFYLDVSPGLGRSSLTLEKPIMQVISPGGTPQPFLEESNWYAGFMASVGAEINITRTMGAFAAWSYGVNRINGALFNDTGFTNSQFEMGIVFRLFHRKDYYRL